MNTLYIENVKNIQEKSDYFVNNLFPNVNMFLFFGGFRDEEAKKV